MKKINKVEYICNMCGDKFYSTFNEKDLEDYPRAIPCSKAEQPEFETDWVFEFDIPTPGYGSFLDGAILKEVHICDSCLRTLYENLEIKPEAINY